MTTVEISAKPALVVGENRISGPVVASPKQGTPNQIELTIQVANPDPAAPIEASAIELHIPSGDDEGSLTANTSGVSAQLPTRSAWEPDGSAFRFRSKSGSPVEFADTAFEVLLTSIDVNHKPGIVPIVATLEKGEGLDRETVAVGHTELSKMPRGFFMSDITTEPRNAEVDLGGSLKLEWDGSEDVQYQVFVGSREPEDIEDHYGHHWSFLISSLEESANVKVVATQKTTSGVVVFSRRTPVFVKEPKFELVIQDPDVDYLGTTTLTITSSHMQTGTGKVTIGDFDPFHFPVNQLTKIDTNLFVQPITRILVDATDLAGRPHQRQKDVRVRTDGAGVDVWGEVETKILTSLDVGDLGGIAVPSIDDVGKGQGFFLKTANLKVRVTQPGFAFVRMHGAGKEPHSAMALAKLRVRYGKMSLVFEGDAEWVKIKQKDSGVWHVRATMEITPEQFEVKDDEIISWIGDFPNVPEAATFSGRKILSKGHSFELVQRQDEPAHLAIRLPASAAESLAEFPLFLSPPASFELDTPEGHFSTPVSKVWFSWPRDASALIPLNPPPAPSDLPGI